MAYKTYTTDAIVCGSHDTYTSDRSFLLFTREAGMLWATARSVRVEQSKQRYALQDFSLIRVSLIKGKGGWRIGSVEAIHNPFMEAHARTARAGIAAVIKLVRRFVRGEDPQPKVYDDLATVLVCLAIASPDDGIDLQDQFTLRTLHNLGYIAPRDSFRALIASDDPWSVPTQISAEAKQSIAQALAVSHL